ncbi:MAG: hypothetical protein JJT94_06820 [Bernardetiaceae bacterium]|nr:hypothetical protein [Bernardetiaceae bacterium]
MMKHFFTLLFLSYFLVACGSSSSDKLQESSQEQGYAQIVTTLTGRPYPPEDFVFLADKKLDEGEMRKANFYEEDNFEITKERLPELYKHYTVKSIYKDSIQDLEYFNVFPEKFYKQARYFTRILKFEGKVQMQSITFNSIGLKFFEPLAEGGFLVGLESPDFSDFFPICRCAKVGKLDKDLTAVNMQTFQFAPEDTKEGVFKGDSFTQINKMFVNDSSLYEVHFYYSSTEPQHYRLHEVVFDAQGSMVNQPVVKVFKIGEGLIDRKQPVEEQEAKLESEQQVQNPE